MYNYVQLYIIFVDTYHVTRDDHCMLEGSNPDGHQVQCRGRSLSATGRPVCYNVECATDGSSYDLKVRCQEAKFRYGLDTLSLEYCDDLSISIGHRLCLACLSGC